MVNDKNKHWNRIISEFDSKLSTKKSKEDKYIFTIDLLASLPHFNWTGIYWLNSDGDLELFSHYVGKPTDHTIIPVGRGVCGTAVAENRDIIVDDVLTLDNYLACSAETRSEIVVLIRDTSGQILGQIDIDSDDVAAFDDIDRKNMNYIANKLGEIKLL